MKANSIWTQEISSEFSRQPAGKIEELLELMTFSKENKIDQFINDISLYDNPIFSKWIYSTDCHELNDIKRELQIKIARSRHVDDIQQSQLLRAIGILSTSKTVGIDFENPSAFFIYNQQGFIQACREYLKNEDESDFIDDMLFCFPNLYFHPSVKTSLHTLNRNFRDIRNEIIAHLTALDDYCKKFLEMTYEHKGYREMAAAFQKYTHIECSPQASRDHVKSLKYSFTNTITNQTEEITCELHTKFRKHNINRQKQDRIYFAPPRPEILDGKVIIVHIGAHL